ncbi:MAG: GAF domain-containing protein, partial [Syntrophorhabdales bacterium]
MYTALLLVTDESRVEFANQAFCDCFDLNDSPADLLGLTPSEIFAEISEAYLHPDEAIARIREIVDRGQPVKNEEVAMAGERELLRDFIPIHINGKPYGRLWYHTDITERKLREARITRLTQLYSMLVRVNETIVRTCDQGLLYDEVCRIIAEEGAFPLVRIGEVRQRQLVPVASYGSAADYLKEITVEIDGALGQGPTGTCVREDHPVVNDDFDTNAATGPWRRPAVRRGFRTSAAFPLHRRNKVVAALTIYAIRPHDFDAEQVDLLQALTADVSYALDTMEQD